MLRTELGSAELTGAAADGAAAGAAVATVVTGDGLVLVVLKIAARPPKRPPPDTRPKMELGVPLLPLLADEEPPPLVLVTAPVHVAALQGFRAQRDYAYITMLFESNGHH